MQDNTTAVVDITAACDLGNCGNCRGTVYTLTKGLGSPVTSCQHGCHDPAPVQDQELDDLLAEDADRRNDDLAVWS